MDFSPVEEVEYYEITSQARARDIWPVDTEGTNGSEHILLEFLIFLGTDHAIVEQLRVDVIGLKLRFHVSALVQEKFFVFHTQHPDRDLSIGVFLTSLFHRLFFFVDVDVVYLDDAWFDIPRELDLDVLTLRMVQRQARVIATTGYQVESTFVIFSDVKHLFLIKIPQISLNVRF